MRKIRAGSCAVVILVLAAVASMARAAGEPEGTAEEVTSRLRALIIDGASSGKKPFVMLKVVGRLTRVQVLGADAQGVTVAAPGGPARVAWGEIAPKQFAALAGKFAATGREHLLVARYCALFDLRERMEKACRKARELDAGLEEEIRSLMAPPQPETPEEPEPPPEETTAEEAGKPAPTITLVANGRPNAVIVAGKNDVEQACAKELQLYLARISGAAIPIAKKAPRKTRKSVIFVANNRRVKGYKLDTRGLVGSGFRIVTTRKDVILLGRDDKGTESSVRRFLEKYCGVRWHMPGELAVPKRRTVRIERMHVEMGAVSVHGATYFVAKNGRDSNPGTEAEPWLTIQKAAGRLKAGDTVYIKEGTYNGKVIPKNSGSPGKYITYSVYPGHTVTIDGTGMPAGRWYGVFQVVDKSYIRITSLRVTKSSFAGIFMGGSNHIIVERNHTYDTWSSGIAAWGCSDIIVDSNEVELACNGGSQECITMSKVVGFEVRNNEVHLTGPEDLGGEGIDMKEACSDGKIHGNHVHDMLPELGIYVDAWTQHCHDIDIYENVIHDCTNGIVVACERGGTAENITYYNNVVYNNTHNGLVVAGYGEPKNPLIKNIKVMNNTFHNNGTSGSGGGIAVWNKNAENIVIRNNICSRNTGFQIVVPRDIPAGEVTVEHNLTDGRKGWGEVQGTHRIVGDAKFVNPSEADFRLQQGSPAIDRGSPVDAPEHDFDAHNRQGARYDIGAYEYQW